jgi:hypothetical protein
MATIQKSFIILTLFIMSTLYSCTIYRTPRVENATYKNFEYEFKFRVPNGWHVQKTMPKSLEQGLANYFTKNFVVMLIHPQNKSMIIVEANKSNEDILSLGYNNDAFKERLLARINEREQEMTTSNLLEDYTYEVGQLTVTKGYGPSFIYKESAKSKDGEQYTRSEYLNQCQDKCSCDITLTLISKQNDFQNNYQVFSMVSDSVKKVYK